MTERIHDWAKLFASLEGRNLHGTKKTLYTVHVHVCLTKTSNLLYLITMTRINAFPLDYTIQMHLVVGFIIWVHSWNKKILFLSILLGVWYVWIARHSLWSISYQIFCVVMTLLSCLFPCKRISWYFYYIKIWQVFIL